MEYTVREAARAYIFRKVSGTALATLAFCLAVEALLGTLSASATIVGVALFLLALSVGWTVADHLARRRLPRSMFAHLDPQSPAGMARALEA